MDSNSLNELKSLQKLEDKLLKQHEKAKAVGDLINYEKHKLNIFPAMDDTEYSALKNDIKMNGYDQTMPIWLYQGAVLDGWNRLRACMELGIKPFCKEFEGDDMEAFEFCVRTNKRRNLNSSQKACIAVDAHEIMEGIRAAVEAERRRKISERENVANQHSAKVETRQLIASSPQMQTKGAITQLIDTQPPVGKTEPLGNKLPEGSKSNPDKNKAAQKVAELFDTNRTYVSDAAKLKASDPEKFKQVQKGTLTITEAKKEMKKDILLTKQAEYQGKIKQIKQKTATESIDIFSTDKKFRVIYADPPWSYNDKQSIPNLGGAEKHYQTMPIADICALPVKNIVTNDGVLFLWAVSPLLPEALEVIKAWGFSYKACFVWDKIKHNMGHYNSVRHEFLLIGTKGSCTPDEKKLYDSVQNIEKSEMHSEKPVEFANIIDDLYTHGDRIELFARKTRGSGWAFWGNEV